jgi:hypothetical protein
MKDYAGIFFCCHFFILLIFHDSSFNYTFSAKFTNLSISQC